MKTALISKAAGALVALFVSVLLSNSGLAGPGSQYWQSSAKSNDSASLPAKVSTTHLCPGAQTVPVTALKPDWTNGRGPLAETQTGSKVVCRMCPVTTVVTTNAWSNGRGPATRTEIPQPGAAHDCSTGCGTMAAK
jgi:hypothetical protein